jgi:hypothetical protein
LTTFISYHVYTNIITILDVVPTTSPEETNASNAMHKDLVEEVEAVAVADEEAAVVGAVAIGTAEIGLIEETVTMTVVLLTEEEADAMEVEAEATMDHIARIDMRDAIAPTKCIKTKNKNQNILHVLPTHNCM